MHKAKRQRKSALVLVLRVLRYPSTQSWSMGFPLLASKDNPRPLQCAHQGIHIRLVTVDVE